MDRPPTLPSGRAAPWGLAVCALALVVPMAWALGWPAPAVLAGLAAFALGGLVAGTDSRRPGDWGASEPS